MKLSVILPIFNEEKILKSACQEFSKHFNKIIGKGNWQYVFSENGSKDNSPAIIRDMLEIYENSIHLSLKKSDYGKALREGILASKGENILIMNIDHLWDTNFFHWAWKNKDNYDLIIGSKRSDPTLNKQDSYRKLLSNGLNTILQFLFDSVVADTHGMKLLKALTIKTLAKECVLNRGQFDTELTLRALRAKYWVAEVPIPYIEKRKPRNLMIRKITQNIFDIYKLKKIMKQIQHRGTINYRRFCAEDLKSD